MLSIEIDKSLDNWPNLSVMKIFCGRSKKSPKILIDLIRQEIRMRTGKNPKYFRWLTFVSYSN